MRWLKNAFALDEPGEATPTDGQRAIADRLCREVVRRHLTTPALAFLEMSRPLSFFSSQALHFFAPLIGAITDKRGHLELAEFLERRGAVDYFVRRIEEMESEAEQSARTSRSDGLTVSETGRRGDQPPPPGGRSAGDEERRAGSSGKLQ